MEGRWQSVVVQGGIQRIDECAVEAQGVQGDEDGFGTRMKEMERRVGSTQRDRIDWLESEREKQRGGQSNMWTSCASGSVRGFPGLE